MQSIGTYAFEYCPLTAIDIPGSLTRIEKCAFYGCKFTTFLCLTTILA
ncbi:MAG: leucine-rich repeat domain-containing protein [Tannerellaceae bacterium]|nr:leucine-rich repeat domain-containing protein [Tannerellaceae bacterium]